MYCDLANLILLRYLRKSDESLGLERMPSAVNMMLVWAGADPGMSLDGSSDPSRVMTG